MIEKPEFSIEKLLEREVHFDLCRMLNKHFTHELEQEYINTFGTVFSGTDCGGKIDQFRKSGDKKDLALLQMYSGNSWDGIETLQCYLKSNPGDIIALERYVKMSYIFQMHFEKDCKPHLDDVIEKTQNPYFLLVRVALNIRNNDKEEILQDIQKAKAIDSSIPIFNLLNAYYLKDNEALKKCSEFRSSTLIHAVSKEQNEDYKGAFFDLKDYLGRIPGL